MNVTIPDEVVQGGQDLLQPLQDLLRGLNLLGKATSLAGDGKDPGAEVLEANATNLARYLTPAVSAVGGTGAVGAVITGFQTQSDSVRIAALAGGTAIIAAAVLAFAYVAGRDLKSRTEGTLAIYQARNAITQQYLSAVLTAWQDSRAKPGAKPEPGPASSPPEPSPSEVIIALALAGAKANVVHTKDLDAGHLAGIVREDGEIYVRWIDESSAQRQAKPAELELKDFVYDS